MTTETDVKVDISTLPVVKEKPKSPRGGRRGEREGLDEAALEREFKNFAIKLRKQFGEDVVAYQVSNYPEGLEFSVRVAKNFGRQGAMVTRSFDSKTEKKEIVKKKKEMTDEQKAKRAEKQARRREYFEKKRQERLENGAKEDDSGKEESAKESQ